jgi:hypothetical protein
VPLRGQPRYDRLLRETGELVAAEGLADRTRAKTVRFENGTPIATDGPLAETKPGAISMGGGASGSPRTGPSRLEAAPDLA